MKNESFVLRNHYCRAKLFASMLLSFCESLKPSADSKFRVFSCYLNTFNSCIDEQQIELAKLCHHQIDLFFKVMELVKVEFEEHLKKNFKTVEINMYLADLQYCILLKDYTVARFYESKLLYEEILVSDKAIEVARILLNCGITAFELDNFKDAHYFLQKCCVLTEKTLKSTREVSQGIANIHYSSLKLLVECCSKESVSVSNEEARNLVNMLLKDFPWKVEPYKLLVDLLYQQKKPASLIREVLMNMIMSVDLKENGKNLLGALNSFADQDSAVVKECLHYLIQNKVDFDAEGQQFCEECVVSLFWIISNNASNKENIDDDIKECTELFSLCHKKFLSPLSRESLNSFATLVWKTSKGFMKNRKYTLTLKWLKLASNDFLQPLFSLFPEIGKIIRLRMRAYLELGKYQEIDLAFQSLEADNDKNNALTQFYMFCSQLYQDKGEESILSHLKLIQKSNDLVLKFDLLALCASEAQNKNNTTIFGTAALLLAQSYKEERLKSGHQIDSTVYVILKSFVYLTMKRIDNWKSTSGTAWVLNCFDEAIALLKLQLNDDNNTFPVDKKGAVYQDDLEWFASKAYTAGTRCLEEYAFEDSIKFFQLSEQLIDMILTKGGEEDALAHLLLWKCRCLVLISKINYLCIKENDPMHSKSWHQISKDCEAAWNLSSNNISESPKWYECYSESLLLHIQALWELHEYEKVLDIIRNNVEHDLENVLCFVVDLICSSSGEITYKKTIVSYILDTSFDNHSIFTISTLVHECKLFLEFFAFDENCFRYLDLLLSKMNVSSDSTKEQNIEIDWIAITSWNNFVDDTKNGCNDQAEKWYHYALGFSDYSVDRTLKQQVSLIYSSKL